jgi:hypothetical protein
MKHWLAIAALIIASVTALDAGQVMSKVVVNGHKSAAAPTTPSGISGLIFWYSADCINAGACASQPSNGTGITTWKDRSSSANDLTCSNTTSGGPNGPVFTTNELNSLPAVVTVATGVTGQSCAFGTAITWPGAETIFAVVQAPSGLTQQPIIASTLSNALMWRLIQQQTLIQIYVGVVGLGNANVEDGNFHQINFAYTTPSGAYAFRANEATDGSGTSAVTSITAAQNELFNQEGGPYASLTVCEIFAYNTAISGPNVTAMETYLHTKYGI